VEVNKDPSYHNVIPSAFNTSAAYPMNSFMEVSMISIGVATETQDIVCIDFNTSLATIQFYNSSLNLTFNCFLRFSVCIASSETHNCGPVRFIRATWRKCRTLITCPYPKSELAKN